LLKIIFHIERLKNQKLEKRITFDIYKLEKWIRVNRIELGFPISRIQGKG
jgi:hypothetical protein